MKGVLVRVPGPDARERFGRALDVLIEAVRRSGCEDQARKGDATADRKGVAPR